MRSAKYQPSRPWSVSPTAASWFFSARFVSASSPSSTGPAHSAASSFRMDSRAAAALACSTPLSTHSAPVSEV